jgi:hypothetical protein
MDARRQEAEKLKEIKQRVAMASPIWLTIYDSNGPALAVRRKSGAEPEIIAPLDPLCSFSDQELLAHAHEDQLFLIALVDRAIAALRAQHGPSQDQAPPQGETDDPKNYAAELAIKCTEPAFLKFLEERHGLERPLTKERADTKVKFILRIGSKTQLNEPGPAAERWKNLRADFNQWRRS